MQLHATMGKPFNITGEEKMNISPSRGSVDHAPFDTEAPLNEDRRNGLPPMKNSPREAPSLRLLQEPAGVPRKASDGGETAPTLPSPVSSVSLDASLDGARDPPPDAFAARPLAATDEEVRGADVFAVLLSAAARDPSFRRHPALAAALAAAMEDQEEAVAPSAAAIPRDISLTDSI